ASAEKNREHPITNTPPESNTDSAATHNPEQTATFTKTTRITKATDTPSSERTQQPSTNIKRPKSDEPKIIDASP
ncbi:Hypothetical predicted protein, partial [Paramuricea clavata]